MFKFIKTKDKTNEYDIQDIIIRVADDSNLTELISAFRSFVGACGYMLGTKDIELIDYSDTDKSYISINLTENELNNIKKLAEITNCDIKDAVKLIISEYLESSLEFNSFVDKLKNTIEM